MLNDPRIARHDKGTAAEPLDRYDPALAVKQGFRPIEPVQSRSIFWCLMASLCICIIVLIIDLA